MREHVRGIGGRWFTGCRKVREKRCIAQSEGAERRSSVGTFGAWFRVQGLGFRV